MSTAANHLADPRLSLATFAQDLMEQVFLRVRTGDMRAGQLHDKYVIVVGDHVFEGSPEKAWTGLFCHIMDQKDPTADDRARFEEAGSGVDEEAAEKTAQIIEALTEGGMTQLGQATEAERQERRKKILDALPGYFRELKDGLPSDPDVFNQQISELVGFEVEPNEIRFALETYNAEQR